MKDLNLIKICEPDSEHEARVFQEMLDEAGIRAMVTGLDVSALGEALDGADFIELYVRQEDAVRAKEMIAEYQAEPEESIPAWTCQCGEQVDEGFFVCWSCQATYDQQPD